MAAIAFGACGFRVPSVPTSDATQIGITDDASAIDGSSSTIDASHDAHMIGDAAASDAATICGKLGHACCTSGTACEPQTECSSAGTCASCGHLLESCCDPGATCGSILLGVCSNGTCISL